MQLPEDYDGGPMTQSECTQLDADEQAEAGRHGYLVRVQQVTVNGELFVHVTYSEPNIGGPGTTASVLKTTGQGIPAFLAEAGQAFGVSSRLLAAIAFVESSMNPNAKNPRSTAFGLFQFLDATLAMTVNRHGQQAGVALSDRAQPRAQCLMGGAFTSDNQSFLQQALGRALSDGECYAAHFLGAGGARRLLSAPANASARDALGPTADGVIKANPDIFLQNGAVRTVGQVLAVLNNKVDGAAHRAQALLNGD